MDRRFLVAAAGAAAAILLPVAATLVLAGLAPQVDADAGWMLVAPGGTGLTLPDDVRTAVWIGEADGVRVAAMVVGDPVVTVGEAASFSGADVTLHGVLYAGVERSRIALVPDDAYLVHPAVVDAYPVAAIVDSPVAGSVPARGADAFESLGILDLRGSFWLLIVASMPATIAVAAAFAGQELRQQARTAAAISALGAPEVARRMLGLRVVLVAGVGGALAALVGGGLWLFGGTTFHPRDTPVLAVFLAVALPTMAAAVAGFVVVRWRLRDAATILQGVDGDTFEPRLPLPVHMRPLALGIRVLPVVVLAAALFVVDLGFPLAAAQIPGAIAGQGDEWVEGGSGELSVGTAVAAAPGHVLRHHEDVKDSIAEVVVPTTVNGRPVLVRGGMWDDMARYHGLRLVAGSADGWVVGDKAAARLGLDVGDAFWTQASTHALPYWAEVAGVFQSGGLLADEVVAPAAEARVLADLGPSEASVVRVRPADAAALAALESTAGRVEVASVRVGTGVVGGIAMVDVELVNVGGGTASRTITIRVDGEPQWTEVVRLGAYGRVTKSVPVLVPGATFDVAVNPEATGQAGASVRHWSLERIQFDHQAITATLDGMDAGGRNATMHASLGDAQRRSAAVATTVTDAGGKATWPAPPPGTYFVAAGDAVARVQIVAAAFEHLPRILVEHVWIEGSQRAGAPVIVHAHVSNTGGAVGERTLDFTLDGARFHSTNVRLEPGESRDVQVAWTLRDGKLQVSGAIVEVDSPSGSTSRPRDSDIESAKAIQNRVADRVLGDARQALVGMATIAMASSLSIVYLATDRALRGRVATLHTLHALGEDSAAIRRRAAWEAAIIGGLGFLLALGIGKLLFRFLGAIGWPAPFGHSLPDPFGWVFALQALTAFSAACALAAFLATGPLVKAMDK